MSRTKVSKGAKKSRSYLLPCHANVGKQQAVVDLLEWWQRGLVHVQLIQSRRMRQGERLGYLDTKGFPGYLSQRQWKSVVNQVNAALKSWQELAVIEVRSLITEMTGEDTAERIYLYRVNKAHAWWGNPVLEPLLIRLMRTKLPLPNLSQCRTMNMDGPVAQHEAPTSSQFSLWVRVSVRPGHGPVRLPFKGSAYEQVADGKRSEYLQVHVPLDGPVQYRVVKHSLVAPERDRGREVGIDWGLASLVATSDGRRLGTHFFSWLKARDIELTILAASLQRQKISLRSSKRYRRLSSRITSYVTNEVGRVLNALTSDQVKTLVVEALDFRSSDLSRQMNRILSRAGRGAWKRKLASLTEDKGVQVVEVNAAHTSRQCFGCGYTDPRNRPRRGRFACRFCGLTLHADINAARVILARRSSVCASVQMHRSAVLAHLDRSFDARWGIEASRVRERQASPHSRATRQPRKLGTGQPVSQKRSCGTGDCSTTS